MWKTAIRGHNVVSAKHLVTLSGICRLHKWLGIEVILIPQLSFYKDKLVCRIHVILITIFNSVLPGAIKKQCRRGNTRAYAAACAITKGTAVNANTEVMYSNCHHNLLCLFLSRRHRFKSYRLSELRFFFFFIEIFIMSAMCNYYQSSSTSFRFSSFLCWFEMKGNKFCYAKKSVINFFGIPKLVCGRLPGKFVSDSLRFLAYRNPFIPLQRKRT